MINLNGKLGLSKRLVQSMIYNNEQIRSWSQA